MSSRYLTRPGIFRPSRDILLGLSANDTLDVLSYLYLACRQRELWTPSRIRITDSPLMDLGKSKDPRISVGQTFPRSKPCAVHRQQPEHNNCDRHHHLHGLIHPLAWTTGGCCILRLLSAQHRRLPGVKWSLKGRRVVLLAASFGMTCMHRVI